MVHYRLDNVHIQDNSKKDKSSKTPVLPALPLNLSKQASKSAKADLLRKKAFRNCLVLDIDHSLSDLGADVDRELYDRAKRVQGINPIIRRLGSQTMLEESTNKPNAQESQEEQSTGPARVRRASRDSVATISDISSKANIVRNLLRHRKSIERVGESYKKYHANLRRDVQTLKTQQQSQA